jgi:anti-sigma factor RsiW
MQIHGRNDLISAYLDGELSDKEADAIQEHISCCFSCQEEYASLHATKAFLARAPRRAMPPELATQLIRKLSQPVWRVFLSRLLPPARVLVPAGALAAAALAAVVCSGLCRFSPNQTIALEPLLAAHSRYAAEALVPACELVAANYSAQLNAYYSDSPDWE